MELSNLPSFQPLSFFSCSFDLAFSEEPLLKKPFLLPELSALIDEDSFSTVSCSWSFKGLHFYIDVQRPFVEVFYPDFSKGDALELFIDTYNMQSSTPYLHHFLYLPKPFEGVSFKEITRLRADVNRPLADSNHLKGKTTFFDDHYHMELFLPKEELYGFDPEEGKHIGLSYRLHSGRGEKANFSSTDFKYDHHPKFWAGFELFKEHYEIHKIT
ncbi:MAG: hypothetical protein WDZ28_02850 [Simkaniaceae bacterium]